MGQNTSSSNSGGLQLRSAADGAPQRSMQCRFYGARPAAEFKTKAVAAMLKKRDAAVEATVTVSASALTVCDAQQQTLAALTIGRGTLVQILNKTTVVVTARDAQQESGPMMACVFVLANAKLAKAVEQLLNAVASGNAGVLAPPAGGRGRREDDVDVDLDMMDGSAHSPPEEEEAEAKKAEATMPEAPTAAPPDATSNPETPSGSRPGSRPSSATPKKRRVSFKEELPTVTFAATVDAASLPTAPAASNGLVPWHDEVVDLEALEDTIEALPPETVEQVEAQLEEQRQTEREAKRLARRESQRRASMGEAAAEPVREPEPAVAAPAPAPVQEPDQSAVVAKKRLLERQASERRKQVELEFFAQLEAERLAQEKAKAGGAAAEKEEQERREREEREALERLEKEKEKAEREREEARREREEAERKEREEAERREAELIARQAAERRAREEAERKEAERRAREEAERKEAERRAREEAERIEAERRAREEAERIEAERRAREEAERIEAERRAREEAERKDAEMRARQEAERIEGERIAREEAERNEAERRAQEEAERIEAERRAQEEAERIEAERMEAEKRVREEAERIEAEKRVREEAERIEAERMEAERMEAERIEAERMEAERVAKVEAERIQAEQQAQEQAERMEAERKAREELERIEAERVAREEAERAATASPDHHSSPLAATPASRLRTESAPALPLADTLAGTASLDTTTVSEAASSSNPTDDSFTSANTSNISRSRSVTSPKSPSTVPASISGEPITTLDLLGFVSCTTLSPTVTLLCHCYNALQAADSTNVLPPGLYANPRTPPADSGVGTAEVAFKPRLKFLVGESYVALRGNTRHQPAPLIVPVADLTFWCVHPQDKKVFAIAYKKAAEGSPEATAENGTPTTAPAAPPSSLQVAFVRLRKKAHRLSNALFHAKNPDGSLPSTPTTPAPQVPNRTTVVAVLLGEVCLALSSQKDGAVAVCSIITRALPRPTTVTLGISIDAVTLIAHDLGEVTTNLLPSELRLVAVVDDVRILKQLKRGGLDNWQEELLVIAERSSANTSGTPGNRCYVLQVGKRGMELCKLLERLVKEAGQRQQKLKDNPFAPSPQKQPKPPQLPPALQKAFVPRGQLTVDQIVGRGQFGEVYLARQKLKDGKEVQRAVKKLRQSAPPEEQAEFLQEAEATALLRHRNIVTFVGLDVSAQPWLLVLEYMPYGDLRAVLKDLAGKSVQLTNCELLKCAIQLCKAMVYIAQQGYVHLDFAARNCLLGASNRIKLCDFGLTRKMPEGQRYMKVHESVGKMPLKWLPVESLFQGIFGQGSDVWAFGVVVWEFYSYGQTPFGTLRGTEFQERIKAGLRLSKPFNCPDNIFAICQQCWHARWRERPTFMRLLKLLAEVAKEYVAAEQRSSSGIRDLGKLYRAAMEGGEKAPVQPARLANVPRITMENDKDLQGIGPEFEVESFVAKIGDLPKFNEPNYKGGKSSEEEKGVNGGGAAGGESGVSGGESGAAANGEEPTEPEVQEGGGVAPPPAAAAAAERQTQESNDAKAREEDEIDRQQEELEEAEIRAAVTAVLNADEAEGVDADDAEGGDADA